MAQREIKFRAWCESLKLMQAPFDLVKDKGMLGALGEIHNEDYELMQYTGLKDKNGVEIYEGDIVKAQYETSLPKRQVFDLGQVTFDKGCFSFLSVVLGESALRLYDELEVIGNIYENRELLERSDPQPNKEISNE